MGRPITVSEEIFRRELPPLPEGFNEELAGIMTYRGKPLFRCVSGLKEVAFLNGRMQPKYRHPNTPYARVARTTYRRRYTSLGTWKHYHTVEAATSDLDPRLEPLSQMEAKTKHEVRAIPRPCWVIEFYQPAEEIDPDDWEKHRYIEVDSFGVPTTLDAKGPYPSEGRYLFLMDVIDENGHPRPPGQDTLQTIRKGLQLKLKESHKSTEQRVKEDEDAFDAWEEEQVKRLTENFFDLHGIVAKRIRGAEISKPILTTLE